jgi:uncharacterized protein (DUF2235 family)
MSKNIVLFVDGTWNIPTGTERTTPTNVHTLYELVSESASQTKDYLAGIGTGEFEETGEPQPPSRTRRFIARLLPRSRHLLAGFFGLGTKHRITRAYQFLSGQYVRGDRVFLFGFSRGAFAARSLAGFVDAVGLLLQDKIHLVEKAYALYEDGTDRDQSPLDRFLRDMTGAGRPTGDDVATLPIYFIGVWDSVAALGLPRHLQRLSARWTEHHQTEVPSNVTHARHALALHELRTDYPPLLWRGRNPQNANQTLEQAWFAGAHADVGGGYPERDLSAVAFAWMAREAAAVGLQLTAPPPKDALASTPTVLHHELRGLFALSTPTVRDALLHRNRLEPRTLETFRIHPSVLQRLSAAPRPQYGFWSSRINKTLGGIDQLSLQFHLELSFNPSGGAGAAAPEWWRAVRVEEVAGCADRVRDFLTASGVASEPEREVFMRSFCLWMLCDEADVTKAVGELVERTSASREAEFLHPDHGKLDVLGGWVLRLRAVAAEVKRAESLLPAHRRAETATLAAGLEQLHGRLNGDLVAMVVRAGLSRPLSIKR